MILVLYLVYSPGRYLPACLMIHTGTFSTSSPFAALKMRSFLRGGKFSCEEVMLYTQDSPIYNHVGDMAAKQDIYRLSPFMSEWREI